LNKKGGTVKKSCKISINKKQPKRDETNNVYGLNKEEGHRTLSDDKKE
jgi:hypothetical protein